MTRTEGSQSPMMNKHAKFGPVQVHFREDGTLSIYQPDHNHVLSRDTAEQFATWLVMQLAYDRAPDEWRAAVDKQEAAAEQSSLNSPASGGTVPDGVICTTEGPVTPAGLTDTEIEADKNAAEARAALAQSTPDPKPTTAAEPSVADDSSHSRESVPVVKRRPGRPRKATP